MESLEETLAEVLQSKAPTDRLLLRMQIAIARHLLGKKALVKKEDTFDAAVRLDARSISECY